jgi:alpha-methylacyl-CoA racemase
MEKIFALRTRDEWESHLSALDACCEPVLDLDEVAAHPQVAARRLIGRYATGVEVAPAVRLRDDWRRNPAPRIGEHTAELLAELGIDGARLDELKAAGAI